MNSDILEIFSNMLKVKSDMENNENGPLTKIKQSWSKASHL